MQSRLYLAVRTAMVAAAIGLAVAPACHGQFNSISGVGGGGGAPPDSSALVQLTLSPLAVTLAPGGTIQYTVTGKLVDGSTIAPNAAFTATGGGTITTGGLFTAGPTAGTELVVATQAGGPTGNPPCCTDTSVVTVTTATMVRALQGRAGP